LLTALAVGIPTDVLPNPWFTRMTPVRTLDLVLWPLTSIIVGVLLATAVLPRTGERQRDLSLGIGCGVLSAFAVGCPVCNKLVVLALGLAGALTYFAHVQPVLGVAALALSTLALKQRLRALSRGCPTGRPGRSPATPAVEAGEAVAALGPRH
jgi:hypothetical protein